MKNFLRKEIHFELISQYRTEWMGIAMCQILLYHILDGMLGRGEIFNMFGGWLGVVCSFLNTRAFLFLSGFGLFYSLSKNSNLRIYYKHRILRLFPAYIICTFIWYVYHDLLQEHDYIRFIADLSLTSFWWWGNEWYLAVSLLLYLVFPVYFFLTKNTDLKRSFLCLLFVIIVIFALNVSLNIYNTDYYQMIRIGISKLHFFFIGAFVAYLAKAKKKCNILLFVVTLIALYILYVFIKHRFYMQLLPELIYDLMYETSLFGALMVMCNFTTILKRIKVFTWMGKYSLEIYLIHIYMYNILKKGVDYDYYLIIVVLCTILLPVPVHVLSGKVCSIANKDKTK